MGVIGRSRRIKKDVRDIGESVRLVIPFSLFALLLLSYFSFIVVSSNDINQIGVGIDYSLFIKVDNSTVYNYTVNSSAVPIPSSLNSFPFLFNVPVSLENIIDTNNSYSFPFLFNVPVNTTVLTGNSSGVVVIPESWLVNVRLVYPNLNYTGLKAVFEINVCANESLSKVIGVNITGLGNYFSGASSIDLYRLQITLPNGIPITFNAMFNYTSNYTIVYFPAYSSSGTFKVLLYIYDEMHEGNPYINRNLTSNTTYKPCRLRKITPPERIVEPVEPSKCWNVIFRSGSPVNITAGALIAPHTRKWVFKDNASFITFIATGYKVMSNNVSSYPYYIRYYSIKQNNTNYTIFLADPSWQYGNLFYDIASGDLGLANGNVNITSDDVWLWFLGTVFDDDYVHLEWFNSTLNGYHVLFINPDDNSTVYDFPIVSDNMLLNITSGKYVIEIAKPKNTCGGPPPIYTTIYTITIPTPGNVSIPTPGEISTPGFTSAKSLMTVLMFLAFYVFYNQKMSHGQALAVSAAVSSVASVLIWGDKYIASLIIIFGVGITLYYVLGK